MMLLVLGIVIGILACCFLLLLELYLVTHGRGVIAHIENLARLASPAFVAKGSIITPPDEVALNREQILRENAEKGLDTPLEDIL